jgi:hypothetical protein
MVDVELNKGVQILLERMSSNPDEFIPTIRGDYPTKWKDILIPIQMRATGGKDDKDKLSFLNDKEIKALWEKMQGLQGDLFTKQVMNTLLRESYDSREFNVKNIPTTIVPPPATIDLIARLNNLSPKEKIILEKELSSLSRQVAGESPKGLF